jgi:hypothetical protein
MVFLGLAGCVATQYPDNAQGTATYVTPLPEGTVGIEPQVTTTYVAPPPTATTTSTTYVAPAGPYAAQSQTVTSTSYAAPPPTTHYVLPNGVATSRPDTSGN